MGGALNRQITVMSLIEHTCKCRFPEVGPTCACCRILSTIDVYMNIMMKSGQKNCRMIVKIPVNVAQNPFGQICSTSSRKMEVYDFSFNNWYGKKAKSFIGFCVLWWEHSIYTFDNSLRKRGRGVIECWTILDILNMCNRFCEIWSFVKIIVCGLNIDKLWRMN